MINWENPLIAPYRQQLLSTEKSVVRIKLSPANKSSLRRWDSKSEALPICRSVPNIHTRQMVNHSRC